MTKNQFLTDANEYIAAITPNYKKSTIEEKTRKLRMYADVFYLLRQQGKIRCAGARQLTSKDLQTFVEHRRHVMHAKDSTISKDVSLIGMLLTWLDNPARNLYKVEFGNRKPRAYQGKLDPLPNETIDRIYALARTTTDYDVMMGCMAAILSISAGLRPQESRVLPVSAIHLMGNRSTIFVEHVKGEGVWGKPRTAPIMDDVNDIYEKFLAMRARKLEQYGLKSDYLFPVIHGKGPHLAQQSFIRYKGFVEQALGVRFALRDGRRAYGQRMLDKGFKMEQVSVALGHNSVKTTELYYANYRAPKMLQEIFERKDAINAEVC